MAEQNAKAKVYHRPNCINKSATKWLSTLVFIPNFYTTLTIKLITIQKEQNTDHTSMFNRVILDTERFTLIAVIYEPFSCCSYLDEIVYFNQRMEIKMAWACQLEEDSIRHVCLRNTGLEMMGGGGVRQPPDLWLLGPLPSCSICHHVAHLW